MRDSHIGLASDPGVRAHNQPHTQARDKEGGAGVVHEHAARARRSEIGQGATRQAWAGKPAPERARVSIILPHNKFSAHTNKPTQGPRYHGQKLDYHPEPIMNIRLNAEGAAASTRQGVQRGTTSPRTGGQDPYPAVARALQDRERVSESASAEEINPPEEGRDHKPAATTAQGGPWSAGRKLNNIDGKDHLSSGECRMTSLQRRYMRHYSESTLSSQQQPANGQGAEKAGG